MIERPIGKGGMGEVYEASESELGRRIALKFIIAPPNEPEVQRKIASQFLLEARIMAKTNHPGIVTIHRIDSYKDTPYIAMEFVEGSDLAEILANKIFAAEEAKHIFAQMLEALGYLHELKILHRDLKPANLMLQVTGKMKIFDFGIAKDLDNQALPPGASTDTKGTRGYMAPELFRGSPATVRSDIWALGAIFYECLTGQRLAVNTRASGKASTAMSVVYFTEEAIPWVPAELRRIVAKMCDGDPARRYASAAEVLADLNKITNSKVKPTESVLRAYSRRFMNPNEILTTMRASGIPPEALKRVFTMAALHAESNVQTNTQSNTQSTIPSKPASVLPASPLVPCPMPMESVRRAMQVYLAGRITAEQNLARGEAATDYPFSFGRIVWGALIGGIALLVVYGTWSVFRTKIGLPSAPPTIFGGNQYSPKEGSTLWIEASRRPTFRWPDSLPKGVYKLQVSSDRDFKNINLEENVEGTFHRTNGALNPGAYYWRIFDPARPQENIKILLFYLGKREVPEIISHSLVDAEGTRPKLAWHAIPLARNYLVQISTVRDFRTIATQLRTKETSWEVYALKPNTYYWRVTVDDPGFGLWSDVDSFEIF